MRGHPLIEALFQELPPAGSEWPQADRARWLEACEAVLRLVYRVERKGERPPAAGRPGATVEEPA